MTNTRKNMSEESITFKKMLQKDDPLVLIDYLELKTKLSKSLLKKVLNNGGVWLKKFPSSKLSRVRRATTELNLDSYIEFYYDPEFVNMEIPECEILLDQKEWGLWYKPPGLLSQGNEYGDHCTILRSVEKIKGPKKAFLVHRLDREAHGIILIAYTEKAARIYSTKWQKGQVRKFYKVIVKGHISFKYPDKKGSIDFKLDGKDALTSFEIISEEKNSSTLLVQIHTGRLHQIRRHFDMIGFPVLGDPKYGSGNKNRDGMKLLSYRLEFRDPLSEKQISYSLDNKEI
jgi:tRNA pseudouridine32 synthase/23S rRNA pseudouridine746 synthase